MDLQIAFIIMGMIGFVLPVFFILGRDHESVVADPALEEMKERQRRQDEQE
ncbi:MAG: hypothetical protein V5A34_06525 [Halapricum sp.]